MTAFAIGVNRRNVYCDGLRFSWEIFDFNAEQIIVIYPECVVAYFERPEVKTPVVVCLDSLLKQRLIPRLPVLV